MGNGPLEGFESQDSCNICEVTGKAIIFNTVMDSVATIDVSQRLATAERKGIKTI